VPFDASLKPTTVASLAGSPMGVGEAKEIPEKSGQGNHELTRSRNLAQ
jgi:hypothetical protein